MNALSPCRLKTIPKECGKNTHTHRCKGWGGNEHLAKHLRPWMWSTAVPSGSCPLGKWMITVINFTLLQQPVIDSAGKLAKVLETLGLWHVHQKWREITYLLAEQVWMGSHFLNWSNLFELACKQPVHSKLGAVLLSEWCYWRRWWEVAAAQSQLECRVATMGLNLLDAVLCFPDQLFAMRWNNLFLAVEGRRLRPLQPKRSITFSYFLPITLWSDFITPVCGEMDRPLLSKAVQPCWDVELGK